MFQKQPNALGMAPFRGRMQGPVPFEIGQFGVRLRLQKPLKRVAGTDQRRTIQGREPFTVLQVGLSTVFQQKVTRFQVFGKHRPNKRRPVMIKRIDVGPVLK